MKKIFGLRSITYFFIAILALSFTGFFIYNTQAVDPANIVVTEEEAVVRAYENILPSIVSITINGSQMTVNGQPIIQELGGGTGFIVSADGLILTNKHVVSYDNASFVVTTSDGKEYTGSVLGTDPLFDIAIMKIEGSNFNHVKFGDSDKIRVGQSVIAIGNVLAEFPFSASRGIISGIGRSITASDRSGLEENLEGMIQTDASINHGNSGGPLVNLKGEVIGINTAIYETGQALGFSIPINRAVQAINIFKAKGAIVRTFLGVRYQMLTKSFAQANKLPYYRGAFIMTKNNRGEPGIVPGAPAEKAGLKSEDIILEVNGKKLDVNFTLMTALTAYQPNDTVKFKILRAGQELTIPVTLGERKSAD